MLPDDDTCPVSTTEKQHPALIFGRSWLHHGCIIRVDRGQKSFSPIDHHCKRDACTNVDRAPQTADKLHYDSFYYKFWIHGGFIFVKRKFVRKVISNPVMSTQCKACGV